MSSASICPPYGITGIEIENFRGITHASVDDIPEGTSWIFLTGKNGYGKTCVLQAIYAAILGGRDQGLLLEMKDFSLKLKGYSPNKSNFEQEVKPGNALLFLSTEEIPTVAYGPSRLDIQAGTSTNEAKGKSALSYSLFNPDGVLLNIEYELYNWYLRSGSRQLSESQATWLKKRFDTVIKALIGLMPNIDSIEANVETNRIEYVEKDENGHPLPEKRIFEELASGNKSIVALAGDIIIRLSESFLQRETLSPAELEGIVIIDELDLHLHPEWQKKLPGLLSQVFPKVQFIVSTHSPIPFLGAPKNSVFLKVNRTAEEGITVEKLDINIEDLTPNLILSSEIFGFTEIFSVTHDPEKRIRTEDTMEEVAASKFLEKRLKNYFGPEHEQKLKEMFKNGK